MIEFGKTLREAREAKGYSISQLAEITHILPQIIENLEKEDFTRIVAPIYGRGFVKLYCEAVDLEAQPLTMEFMEIFNGNRQPAIRLRKSEDEPEAPASEHPAAQELAPEEPPAKHDIPAPEPPTFDFSASQERKDLFDEPQAPEPKPGPFSPDPDGQPFCDNPTPEAKRDYRLPGYSMPEVPRSLWRFGTLIAAAVATVALLVVGTRALYRATMEAPVAENEQVGKETSAPLPPNPSTINQTPSDPSSKSTPLRMPRKGVAVPPLYID